MFTLAFSFLVMSNFPWFGDLTFQVPMHYHSLQHWTFTIRHIHSWTPFLLWPSYFILSVATSNCPPLFSSSTLDIFWPGGLIFHFHILLPFLPVHGVLAARILEWFVIPSFSGSLWPIHLRWPCTAWLIASLSYTIPFVMTRLWSTKGTSCYLFLYLQTCHKIAIQSLFAKWMNEWKNSSEVSIYGLCVYVCVCRFMCTHREKKWA